jgi:iron complex transport system substrate-binding protein
VAAWRWFGVWVLGAGLVAAEEPVPRRVASLAPSVTETVLALGLGDRLVARTRWCPEVPGAVQTFPDFVQPEVEALLGVRPDLVVVSDPTARDAVRAMARAGLRVERLPTAGVESVWENVARLGTLLGESERGTELAARIRGRVEAVAAAVAGRRRPRTAIFYGTDTVFASGPGSFAGDLLERAGGENVVDGKAGPWPMVGPESLLARDPEVLVFALDDAPESLEGVRRAVSGWPGDPLRGRITAVREGRVMAVGGSLLMIPGPRVGEAAEALAEILHPEARPGSETGQGWTRLLPREDGVQAP